MTDLAAEGLWEPSPWQLGVPVTPALRVIHGNTGSAHTPEQAWEVAGTPWRPGLAEPTTLPHPAPAGTATLGSELLLFLVGFARLFS